MELVLTQEQDELRATVRRFLAAESPMRAVRKVVDGADYDPALWKRLAGELGLAGLAVPEEFGGSGAGQIERSVVLEEAGRALLAAPYLATTLAADALLAIGDANANAELLPAIASGERTATVSLADGLTADGGTNTLTGIQPLVLDGATAETIIVVATTPEGLGFFRVDAGAAGLTRTPLVALDPTRRFARLDFADTPAVALTTADPEAARSAIGDRAALALAAESLGVLAQSLALSVDYAKVRVQFGRYIGSYQAVKHLCVDSHVDYELACSVVRNAAWVADNAPEEFPLAAAHAQVSVLPAAFWVAERTVRIHGGIGYTWEHDAHLYYKRAKSNELLLGTGAAAHAALADRLGI